MFQLEKKRKTKSCIQPVTNRIKLFNPPPRTDFRSAVFRAAISSSKRPSSFSSLISNQAAWALLNARLLGCSACSPTRHEDDVDKQAVTTLRAMDLGVACLLGVCWVKSCRGAMHQENIKKLQILTCTHKQTHTHTHTHTHRHTHTHTNQCETQQAV